MNNIVKKNMWFWLISISNLLLDQLSKYWITKSFAQIGDTIPLLPKIFHFTYVVNTGTAFSFFEGGVVWLRWISLGVSIGLIGLFILGERMEIFEQLGYGFILAGALGNGIDRFFFGYVVDFLDFRLIKFPIFNLADISINFGIILLFSANIFPKSSNDLSH